MESIIKEIIPLRVFILIVFIIVLINYNKEKKTHQLLFYCVAAALLNEIVSIILKCMHLSIKINTTFYIIFNNALWLLILFTISSHKKYISAAISMFLTFAAINLILVQKLTVFNSYTFILGSLLYVTLFIYDSYVELKKENLDYFTNINYLLLFTPILFFIGFSFIFGFRYTKISKVIIFGSVNLFKFISYFVNFFYYSLILFYIYKEKKQENAA